MSVNVFMIIIAYILIGIFVSSAESHYSNNEDGFFLNILVWPVLVVLIGIIAVFWIPYILGKWIGHLLQDLLR